MRKFQGGGGLFGGSNIPLLVPGFLVCVCIFFFARLLVREVGHVQEYPYGLPHVWEIDRGRKHIIEPPPPPPQRLSQGLHGIVRPFP